MMPIVQNVGTENLGEMTSIPISISSAIGGSGMNNGQSTPTPTPAVPSSPATPVHSLSTMGHALTAGEAALFGGLVRDGNIDAPYIRQLTSMSITRLEKEPRHLADEQTRVQVTNQSSCQCICVNNINNIISMCICYVIA